MPTKPVLAPIAGAVADVLHTAAAGGAAAAEEAAAGSEDTRVSP